jgi:alpha-beta hydrolase superfamily lysophospholipase
MRTVIKVVTIVVAVLLVLVAALAWYLSGLVLDGAEVKGDTAVFDQEVLSVTAESDDEGTIVYRMPDDVEDPATDEYTVARVGMVFADGDYLQLDQDATVNGNEITRSYTVLAGDAPEVGDLGKWDWASYPDATSQGLTERDVTYDAPLGPTPAIVVDPVASAPTSTTWAVIVHGRGASVRDGLRIVPRFAERGMPSMLINYRDDRQEPDVPNEDGIGDFGMTEWADVEAAVAYATANGAEDIVLVGYSMGGAIVAGFMERAANADAVTGTVLVSPAINFQDSTVFGAEQLGIPTGPLAPIIWLAERFVELRSQIDYEGTDYIDNAATWPVPALVTATTEDDLVPPESIEEFADALPDGTYELFQDAFHTGEWNEDWVEFDALAGDWLDEYDFAAAG